ncbi:hypothetical protein FVEG_06754 [Fusarium verticillioides 7600]|uniref:Uncharacterized protein n=1 Tax=Gibberella moniliformis (strain M3125 / FGSC 7600) TaxID=334819 RepID=W7MF43_GIBM7|nr:hypothetical protein FVEG_06754 [Fusarium verticillioides 7600]EWG46195.1 hypothetical protein FVEG_06754 [Fusarium verticillioides 7600]
MSDPKLGMSYGLLTKTPGLKFPITTPVLSPRICAAVFGGSDDRSKMTKAEVEVIICEFLTECDNHFHRLSICPIHEYDIFAPPCACQEKLVQYYKHIASSLGKSWARQIDPEHVRAIVEATLCARVEAIKENSNLINDIRGSKSLILLNAHIFLCSFAVFKDSHPYEAVHRLYWSVNGALDSQQEATKRKETLLKQQAKRAKSVSGAENTSAED